jgi:hypothetical protein
MRKNEPRENSLSLSVFIKLPIFAGNKTQHGKRKRQTGQALPASLIKQARHY